MKFIGELGKKPAINVLGITDAEYHQLSQNFKNSLNHYGKVSNVEDYNKVLRAVAYFMPNRKQKSDNPANGVTGLVNADRLTILK